jgi:hypothetical protein
VPKGIAGRHGRATVVWNHIYEIPAQDKRMTWNKTGARMIQDATMTTPDGITATTTTT